IGAIATLRLPGRAPRGIAWAVLVGASMALLVAFTLRFAAPNIIIAGQKSAERTAVSELRTLLWAEDQMVARADRAGGLGELATAGLLRTPFAHIEAGTAAVGGFRYAVFVLGPDGPVTDGDPAPPAGAHDWIAYAWPDQRGRSGGFAFCINRFEDILQTENADARYDGRDKRPAWNACVTAADPHARQGEGTGGDGAQWARWRGRETRRGRAAEPVSPAE
ncbi:MAG: hypothetical protein KC620_17600, partial [Myxococcales bacterium]|nr:hypothetical protein [Myxococcales bacterium]